MVMKCDCHKWPTNGSRVAALHLPELRIQQRRMICAFLVSPLIVLERTFCFHTSRYCIVHWTCEHLPCLIIQHFLNYIITFHMSHPWSTLCKHHLWLNVLQWCQHWCQHTISGWERGMGLDGIQVGWGMEHLTVDVDTAYILDTCEVLLVPQCTCHHVYIPNRRQSPGKPM